TAVTDPFALVNGSVLATGRLGIANTGIKDALPTNLILTSGAVVRTYSSFNETTYSDFLRTQAATLGQVRPRLPSDVGVLHFELGYTESRPSLSFAGTALFDAADANSIAGALQIVPVVFGLLPPDMALDIMAPGATPIAGRVSIAADTINAFNAPNLILG